VIQSSKHKVRKWVIAMYLMTTNLKGVSSMKFHRDSWITQKSAWTMAQKIRQGWIQDMKLGGTVEEDEVYIGGKERTNIAIPGSLGKGPCCGDKGQES